MAGANSSRPLGKSRGLNMPDFKSEITARLDGISLSPEREQEIVEELTQHLEEA
jgi:hypothetical protein